VESADEFWFSPKNKVGVQPTGTFATDWGTTNRPKPYTYRFQAETSYNNSNNTPISVKKLLPTAAFAAFSS
jgi:hypothetical protein